MSTILIVDDDPRFRLQARDVLERDGFSVIGEAADGASGLAAARALGFARPDAVRLSRGIGVPVLVGAAALKGLRLIQRRPDRKELATLGLGAAAACGATLASLPLARTLESGRPLAPWAAYRCVLAGVLLVRENRER